jgi:hypothetical protein
MMCLFFPFQNCIRRRKGIMGEKRFLQAAKSRMTTNTLINMESSTVCFSLKNISRGLKMMKNFGITQLKTDKGWCLALSKINGPEGLPSDSTPPHCLKLPLARAKAAYSQLPSTLMSMQKV